MLKAKRFSSVALVAGVMLVCAAPSPVRSESPPPPDTDEAPFALLQVEPQVVDADEALMQLNLQAAAASTVTTSSAAKSPPAATRLVAKIVPDAPESLDEDEGSGQED